MRTRPIGIALVLAGTWLACLRTLFLAVMAIPWRAHTSPEPASLRWQTKSPPVGRLSSQCSLLTLGPNPPDRHLPLKTEELDKENNNQADQNSFK